MSKVWSLSKTFSNHFLDERLNHDYTLSLTGCHGDIKINFSYKSVRKSSQKPWQDEHESLFTC